MKQQIALSFLGCHRRGGVERTVFEYARYLASAGHKVSVYANEWEVDETQPSIEYHYVPLREFPGILKPTTYLKSCTRVMQNASYNVLNTHGCVCPYGGVHRVQSVHRDWLNQSRLRRNALSTAAIKQRLNPLHPIILRLERRHFQERRYKKVIALTQHVKDVLNLYYGVPAEDVVIMPNGFAPDEFNPELRAQHRSEMRAKLGLRQGDVALLFVAHELLRKGYPTIISALAMLKRQDLKLLVVGRTDAAVVKAIAAREGVQDQVQYCGPTDSVASYHAAADLFVLPTQYEAFCLAILEALGSGLPVITSSAPGARDAIVPGVNGEVIADPDDGKALASAIEPYLEAAHRDLISAQAPGTVTGYQWPVLMQAYENLLVEMAG